MKVCIVGAGPSGIATVKQLRDEDHDVVCFEKGCGIGGIWHRHASDDAETKAYDDLYLTISMKLMAFSDFMVDARTYVDRTGYLSYLQAYADKYDLHKHVRLNSSVTEVRKTDEGGWRVTVEDENGARTVHVFDAVVICTGPFETPHEAINGLEKFTGRVLHSSRYRNPKQFAGRRVLIIGLAESGADIVRQVAGVASECTLALRSRPFLIPRLSGVGRASDTDTFRAHHYEMFVRATSVRYPQKGLWGSSVVSRKLFIAITHLFGVFSALKNAMNGANSRPGADHDGQLDAFGQPLHQRQLDLDTTQNREHLDLINDWNRKSHAGESNWSQKVIFCKNVSFIPLIADGTVALKDSQIDDVDGSAVRFEDGTTQEFDDIILCTGFTRDFSKLGDTAVKDNNVRNLYKHVVHPDHGGRLAFVGFIRPYTGGVPACAEMQARYVALLLSDKISLPENLDDEIRKEKAWEEAWTKFSPRHSEAIPSQALYMDSIAREIGCLMTPAELVRRPELLVRHWYYSFNQSCYRLTGPHSMPDVALEQLENEEAPPSVRVWAAAVLSMLPSFVHPRHMNL